MQLNYLHLKIRTQNKMFLIHNIYENMDINKINPTLLLQKLFYYRCGDE